MRECRYNAAYGLAIYAMGLVLLPPTFLSGSSRKVMRYSACNKLQLNQKWSGEYFFVRLRKRQIHSDFNAGIKNAFFKYYIIIFLLCQARSTIWVPPPAFNFGTGHMGSGAPHFQSKIWHMGNRTGVRLRTRAAHSRPNICSFQDAQK